MKKRFLAVTLTLCMGMAMLAGCGSTDTDSSSVSTSSVAATAEDAFVSTAVQEPSTEEASTADASTQEVASGIKTPEEYGENVQAIVEKGVLTLATGTYVPFEYRDENNEIVGFDIDLAQYMADKLGVELQVTDMTFQSIVPCIQNGEYDIAIAAMYDTEARREVVLMSDSYCDTGMILAVQEGSEYANTITSLADCDGLKIAVKAGATSEKVAQDFLAENSDISYEIIGYEDTVGCVSDLLAGRVDVVVNDLLNMKELAKTYSGTVIVCEPFTQAANAAAVQMGKDDLMEFVNDCIAEYKADGTFDTLWAKWIE